eukprot:TRINITY_DN17135_c0_g1_i2.p1 TRINITY_DN17135_c0_g1~~TRINITY_DN17135_c0_g1_i2.p1  ORF type:complete len:380 (+),score=43.15 TRINITY_DN17135_c0_g1_i2:28-1167(+)
MNAELMREEALPWMREETTQCQDVLAEIERGTGEIFQKEDDLQEIVQLVGKASDPLHKRVKYIKAVAVTFAAVILTGGVLIARQGFREPWEASPDENAYVNVVWHEKVKWLNALLLYQEQAAQALSEHNSQHMKLRQLPPAPASFYDSKELEVFDRMLASSNETSSELFARVSHCWCDVSLVCLKFTSAVLNLITTAHVCPQIAKLRQDETGGRRLDIHVATGLGKLAKVEHAQMSCAANIQGAVSGFTAVGQYGSGIQLDCPYTVATRTQDQATCALGINLLFSGLTKSTAAGSDIAILCQPPQDGRVPYSKPGGLGQKDASKRDTALAACLVNVGQATTYLAKVGWSFDALTTSCPSNPTDYQKGGCANQMAGSLPP